MATLNLRSKMDNSLFTELHQQWVDRCTKVKERKESEKTIDKANKDIVRKLSEYLGNKSWLKGSILRIRDNEVILVKGFEIETKDGIPWKYFTIETSLACLDNMLSTEKSAKKIPSTIEQNSRIIDRIVRRQFKNHKIKESTNLQFNIYLETSTKYSF